MRNKQTNEKEVKKVSSKKTIYRMVLCAMFLALAMVLPLLTGQMKTFGKMLCPMHIPVILCGFFCGPLAALGVGFIAPIMRFFIFGKPDIIPNGFGMAFELAAYGFFSGFFYKILPKKNISVYISLIIAMILGRIVWGLTEFLMLNLGWIDAFGISAFISGSILGSIPGILVQIIIIPILVMALKKYTNTNEKAAD